MADEVTISTAAVTLSLHPANVEAISSDEAITPYLKPVVSAFAATYATLIDLHSARVKGEANSAWTKSQVTLEVAKAAASAQDKLIARFQALGNTLDSQIAHLNKSLDTPLKQAAERNVISAEIRSHFKGLSNGDRTKALGDAHERGDHEVLGAILGAPPMLSGLTPEMHALSTRKWNQKNQPEISARLEALQAARKLVEDRGPLLHLEFEKTTGSTWARINKLRTAQTEAERAFVLRDPSADFDANMKLIN
jgi:hypothetical protein